MLGEHHRTRPRLRTAEPSKQDTDKKSVDQQPHTRLQAENRQHYPAAVEKVVAGPVADGRHRLQRKQEGLSERGQLEVAAEVG